MKILVVTKWFIRWNGASNVIYELSRRFKREHEVRIAIYKDYIDPEWEKEFEIYKLQHKGLFAFKEIKTIIKEYKPDIIHSHDWLGLLASFSNIPHVVTTHSNWPMNWFFSPRNFVAGIIQELPHEMKMHLADKVVSVSKHQQGILKKKGLKSEVIYNGIDESYFTPPKKRVHFKHPAILFVSGIDNNKAKYLVPFINLLNQKNKKVHTYVIGKTVNKNIVRRLKKLDNTYYLGVFDDINPYYYEADLLLFLSRVECLPLVPIEAQATGLPVVAFDVCSHSEIIKNGMNGFLTKEGALNEIIDGSLNILKDDDLREKMGKNGIENVKENFLWDDKAEKYIKQFKCLLKGDV